MQTRRDLNPSLGKPLYQAGLKKRAQVQGADNRSQKTALRFARQLARFDNR
jgi:hypothetical protein